MAGTDHASWSTSALIEAAYREQHELDDDSPCPATVALHERGSREVLDAALTLCTSLDSKRRSLGARLLGELGSPERTFPEECCDELVRLLRDPSQSVVISAIYATKVARPLFWPPGAARAPSSSASRKAAGRSS